MPEQLGNISIPHPFIILEGDSGVGKTVLATTLGAGAYLHAFEQNYASAITLQDDFTQARRSVTLFKDYVEPSSFHPDTCIWSQFKKDLDWWGKMYSSPPEGKPLPLALIFDGITPMLSALWRYLLDGDIRIPKFEDWNKYQTEMISVMNKIRFIPCAKILIAHVQWDQRKKYKDDPDPINFLELAVPGKNMPNVLCSMVSEVWLLKAFQEPGNKVSRKLTTWSNDYLKLKTTVQIPNNQDISCGMGKLLDMIGYNYTDKQKEYLARSK